MVPTALRLEGSVRSWNAKRGFGFIAPAQGGRDVFAHISAFPDPNVPPSVGETVHFEVVLSPEGKWRAAHVVPDGAPTRPASPARVGNYDLLAVLVLIPVYAALTLYFALPLWVGAIYLVASALAFLEYARDKAAAVSGRWRVSEVRLLLLGFLGGWPGAIIAQQAFRHKTKKISFRTAFWSTVALNLAGLIAIAIVASPHFTQLWYQLGHAV